MGHKIAIVINDMLICRLHFLFLIINLGLLLLHTNVDATEKSISLLWGLQGEKYNPAGRLPDFSDAGRGYFADEALQYTETINIKDFGAKGDGINDDSQFFKEAIKKYNNIYVPQGVYLINDQLVIEKSDFTIKGDGVKKTIICFGKPLDRLRNDSDFLKYRVNRGNHLWSSGLLLITGTLRGKKLARLKNNVNIGDKSLLFEDSIDYLPGALYRIIVNDNENRDFLKSLYEGDFGNIEKVKRHTYQIFLEIEYVQENEIYLKHGSKFSINKNLSVNLYEADYSTRNVRIEDLSIEMKNSFYKGHKSSEGYNAICLNNVNSVRLKKIDIVNADNGVIANSSFSNFDSINLYSDRNQTEKFVGHHGFLISGSSNLIKNFSIKNKFIHDITVTNFAYGNVFTNGDGVDLNFDHHRSAPYSNLFECIDVGRGTRIWKSSGGKRKGKHSAARNTYWNIKSQSEINFPDNNFGPKIINVIGVKSRGNPVFDIEGIWYEPGNTGYIYPYSLYYSQRRHLN